MSPFNGPTLSVFTCPQCKKRRLYRPVDHVVSDETRELKITPSETLVYFVDICAFCVDKLGKRINASSKQDLRRILKALHDPEADLGDKSLEELL